MTDGRFEALPGFTRGLDPDFDSIVWSECDYCGQSFDGVLESVRHFEREHRMTCNHRPKRPLWILAVLAAVSLYAAHDVTWVLQQSTLAYHVSHPLHATAGVSHAARGKGICTAGQCQFLIAVPVKSFDSGDSNRDLHMLQVTRGAEFPMVTVRVTVPEAELKSGTLPLDLQVQFAGQTADYKHLSFQLTIQAGQAQLTGTIPAKLSDFKIDPPTLLTMPVRNEMPIDVDMMWKQE